MQKLLRSYHIYIIAFLLLIAAAYHGINMFHFPYYENDEGTYMSQAWSLLTMGKLAPYTYWYDHAPVGWMLIAMWVKLTGGFFTFGASVNSGRVLMLISHLLSTILLYFISFRLSKRWFAAVISVLFFSLSPLGIYFQRRVLLDNMMIFWVLFSLSILLHTRIYLNKILISALFFGIAVLTKENAVFFTPAYFYLIYSKAHNNTRWLYLLTWFLIAGSLISTYFLYAYLKGELLPGPDHVSLISAFSLQIGRGSALPFWNPKSDLYGNFLEWFSRDRLIISAGLIASLLSLPLCFKIKSFRVPVLLTMGYILFLIRGKLVLNFYVIPLVPLFSLSIGLLLSHAISWLSLNRYVQYSLFVISISGLIIIYNLQPHLYFTKDETTPQTETIKWIKTHLSQDTFIVIDDSIYTDLHASAIVYANAEWSWKIDKDTSIKDDKLHNDWLNIQYIAASHELLKQIREDQFYLTKQAFDNSRLIVQWKENSTSYLDIPKYISTNGDWMAIYKVIDKNDIAVEKSWSYYKSNFIHSYGQVIDPATESTTSEAQSYALLRAVWMNDKNTFDGVLSWTKDHMQWRSNDKLFSWQWDNKTNKITDSNTAADADEDIALALLFAHERWQDDSYRIQAIRIINDIWNNEVIRINGRYFLTSGTNAKREDGYLINPSYFSPASYRIFSLVDPYHPWQILAADSYISLNHWKQLPPNWTYLSTTNFQFNPSDGYQSDPNASNYGYDAFRITWRVALDAIWFDSEMAKKYLLNLDNVYHKLSNLPVFASIYTTSGQPLTDYNSLSTSTAPLFTSLGINSSNSETLYKSTLEKYIHYDTGTWQDGSNYYDQNWAWFATALYTHHSPNLMSSNP